MISTLNGWPCFSKKASPSSGGRTLRTNGWSALTDSAMRASICGQVVGRQRARQLEVVVEAVGDGRADAQLRVGEQVEHRLGHDVRRRVAHGIERVTGVGVEQLLGRLALGRLERQLFCSFSTTIGSLRESKTSRPSTPRRDERREPPAVPPALATPQRSRQVAHSCCRVNGRRPYRFSGRSRVVRSRPICRPGFQPIDPGSLWPGSDRARPARRFQSCSQYTATHAQRGIPPPHLSFQRHAGLHVICTRHGPTAPISPSDALAAADPEPAGDLLTLVRSRWGHGTRPPWPLVCKSRAISPGGFAWTGVALRTRP